MSLPLAVRLDGPDGSLQLTRNVMNLSFKTNSPGGFDGVEFNLVRPIAAPLLAQFTDLLVFDTETGEQVGGGRLVDQGRTVDASQMVWSVMAVGEGRASMQDRNEPYMLIDSQLDAWYVLTRSSKTMSAGVGTAPTSAADRDGLLCEPSGAVPSNALIMMAHRGPQLCNMDLGGFAFTVDAGVSDGNWRLRPRAHSAGLTGGQIVDYQWTTVSARRKFYASDDFSTAARIAVLNWQRITSNVTATDSMWCGIYSPRVSARRLDRNRQPLLGSNYSPDFVTADQAFTDWVARYCPRLDIENATISAGVEQLEQLTWYDGTDGLAMMEEVLESEAALTWHVWEKQPNGRWATELVALPTAVRYETTIRGGLDAPTPGSELHNRVVVRGKTAKGRDVAQTFVSADFNLTVPELDAAGITRSSTIDLGSDQWSTGAATGAARRFLTEHSKLSNAGTLTVAERVYDRFTGRWVPPWRIRAGELIRYRGVQPAVDGLNSGTSDGVTISRIVSTNFDSDSATAALELDTPRLDERRALAKLMNARKRRQ